MFSSQAKLSVDDPFVASFCAILLHKRNDWETVVGAAVDKIKVTKF